MFSATMLRRPATPGFRYEIRTLWTESKLMSRSRIAEAATSPHEHRRGKRFCCVDRATEPFVAPACVLASAFLALAILGCGNGETRPPKAPDEIIQWRGWDSEYRGETIIHGDGSVENKSLRDGR